MCEVFFSLGDPGIVQTEWILDEQGVFPEGSGECYIPPLSLSGLAKMKRTNFPHGSCILLCRNMAAKAEVKGGFPIADFCQTLVVYLTFGNACLEYNVFGQIGILHVLAINMRMNPKEMGFRLLKPYCWFKDFDPRERPHVAEYDEFQQVYGIPDWLDRVQSALLNEAPTLLRRRYCRNGALIGYILCIPGQRRYFRSFFAMEKKMETSGRHMDVFQMEAWMW